MKASEDILARLRERARELADLGIGEHKTLTHWFGWELEELTVDQAVSALARMSGLIERIRSEKHDMPPPNVVPMRPYKLAQMLRPRTL